MRVKPNAIQISSSNANIRDASTNYRLRLKSKFAFILRTASRYCRLKCLRRPSLCLTVSIIIITAIAASVSGSLSRVRHESLKGLVFWQTIFFFSCSLTSWFYFSPKLSKWTYRRRSNFHGIRREKLHTCHNKRRKKKRANEWSDRNNPRICINKDFKAMHLVLNARGENEAGS